MLGRSRAVIRRTVQVKVRQLDMESLPMDPVLWTIVASLALIGVLGVVLPRRWIRVALWILSVPGFLKGVFVLVEGGTAEPFSRNLIWNFCSVAFWPTAGCTIGAFGIRR